jgi:cathepsin L
MKYVLFAVAVLCFSLVAATRTEADYLKSWMEFTAKYQKSYKHDEVHYRYKIFKANADFVDAHNAKGLTYTVGLNKFADMTNDEFQTYFMGTHVDATTHVRKGQKQSTTVTDPLPDSWDWNAMGAVTPIKNQGQCGSCWSFSTTGSTEGCHFITSGQLVSLSEQNLVDCSTAQGNEGCNGGLMDQAFQYIITNKGIDTEKSYPYTAEDGTCSYSTSNCGSTLTTYTDVTSGSETALQQAVYMAPVSVAIDASQNSFQLYTSGVYYEPACSSTQLDHGVLAAGWGTDPSGGDYWQVKNSWGTDWGQNGWIWMSRNKNNNCGIATMASYPSKCGGCN